MGSLLIHPIYSLQATSMECQYFRLFGEEILIYLLGEHLHHFACIARVKLYAKPLRKIINERDKLISNLSISSA